MRVEEGRKAVCGDVERRWEGGRATVSHHRQLLAAKPLLPPPSPTSISECENAGRRGEAKPGVVLQGNNPGSVLTPVQITSRDV